MKSFHLSFTPKEQVLSKHLVLGDGVEGDVELEAQVCQQTDGVVSVSDVVVSSFGALGVSVR